MAGPVSDYRRMLNSLRPGYLIKQLETDKRGTFAVGLRFLALGFFALLIASLIQIPLSTYLIGTGMQYSYSMNQLVGLAALLILMVVIIIFISAMFLFARLLGGVGSFSSHFYHLSILTGGMLTVVAFLNLLPFIGLFLSLGAVFYSVYLSFLVYSRLHKLSRFRAILLSIIPLSAALLLFILAVILLFALLAVLTGAYSG